MSFQNVPRVARGEQNLDAFAQPPRFAGELNALSVNGNESLHLALERQRDEHAVRAEARVVDQPIDLETLGFGDGDVLGFGSHLLLIHSLDIPDAGDAADGGNHALQLSLVFDFQGHVHQRAFARTSVAGVRFETPDIGLLVWLFA